MTRRTENRLLTVLVVLIVAVVGVIAVAAIARADTQTITIDSAKRTSSDPHVFTYDTNHEGETCFVGFVESNEEQRSAHPGNQIVVSTGGNEIMRVDVETERGGGATDSATALLGPTITIEWDFGPDGVSSNGVVLTLICEPPPPETTTTLAPPETTTTMLASTTTTTQPPTPTPPTTLPAPTPEPAPSPTTTTTLPIPTGVPTGSA